MARIEWIKHRLDNWALWKVREACGGLGWSTQSVLLANVVDSERVIPLPVDETDAQKTNQAVESLKLGRGHLYVTLQLMYIKGIGIRETARQMSRAESTVKANLDAADHALRDWFSAKVEADEAHRRALAVKKSLST